MQKGAGPQEATINLLPLADIVNRILNSQEFGDNRTFEFFIEGDRDSAGVLHSVRITQSLGDPSLKVTGEQFVAALSNSRLLSFLSEAKHLSLKISSSKTDISASASYVAESESRARVTAHGYDALFYGAAMSKRDYEQIYRSLKASSNGAVVTMALSMPRETFCALLSKYLSGN
jgi:hypothetical protein